MKKPLPALLIVLGLLLALGLASQPVEAVTTCPQTDGWVKVDHLSGFSYTYTAPEGYLVDQTCYKAATQIVYEIVNPPASPVTVTSTVTNSNGQLQELSHASFHLIEIPRATPVTPTATPITPTATPVTPTEIATETVEPTATEALTDTPDPTATYLPTATSAPHCEAKVEVLYPQEYWTTSNLPLHYWRGPLPLAGCAIIVKDGQQASAERIVVICSLCKGQIDGGYLFVGAHKVYDDYVYKVTDCDGSVSYWYAGFRWDEYVKSGFEPDGTRTCPRDQGCADEINTEYAQYIEDQQ